MPLIALKLGTEGTVEGTVEGTMDVANGSGGAVFTPHPLSKSLAAIISIMIYCREPFSSCGTYISREIRNGGALTVSSSRPSA
jgi:hypothetical protein